MEVAFPAVACRAPLTLPPLSSSQMIHYDGITEEEFGGKCRGIGLNPSWVRANCTGYKTYMMRDFARDCGEKCFRRIKMHFQVNLAGMRGGETVQEVVAMHTALCEAGGSCAVGAGGASAAAAAAAGFDFEVSALVHFPDFLLPLPLLTHLPAAAFASLCRRQSRSTRPAAWLVGAAQWLPAVPLPLPLPLPALTLR